MEWFRFYHDALNDPKVQLLSGDDFKAWINILCIASQSSPRGTLPSRRDLAFKMRFSPSDGEAMIDRLIASGLLDEIDGVMEPHNWPVRQRQSDSSTPRVRQFRERQKEKGSQTLPKEVDTDTDTDTEKKPLHVTGMKRYSNGYTTEFLEFYEDFPNKTDKKDAFDLWQKIKPDSELRKVIQGAVTRQKQSRKWLDGYVMSPARWLRGRHWEDDVVTQPIATPTIQFGSAHLPHVKGQR
jgi:hypothetical protein